MYYQSTSYDSFQWINMIRFCVISGRDGVVFLYSKKTNSGYKITSAFLLKKSKYWGLKDTRQRYFIKKAREVQLIYHLILYSTGGFKIEILEDKII